MTENELYCCPYCGSLNTWVDWDNDYIRCSDCDSLIAPLWRDN